MAVVLVVGANRGIGLALATQYSERGDQVIATCRRASEALLSLNIEVIEDVDVTADRQIRQLAHTMNNRRLDVLICNAGLMTKEVLGDLDIDRIRDQFEVNTLGPLRVIHALRSDLRNGSKVAIITSRMGSLADNTAGGMYGYRMSKAAVNMAGVCLHRDLHPIGVSVGLFHPGYVRTDMTGNRGLINADDCALQLISRIRELNLHNSGRFLHANGEELLW